VLTDCLANSFNVNATVNILDRTLPDDPFVCPWTGELFAYISLPSKLNEDTDAGTYSNVSFLPHDASAVYATTLCPSVQLYCFPHPQNRWFRKQSVVMLYDN